MLGACPPKNPRRVHQQPERHGGGSAKRIGELYAIEAEIRGMPETERLAARQSRSAPLLAS
jgi:hypothetical protein